MDLVTREPAEAAPRPRGLSGLGLLFYNAVYWPYLILSCVLLFVPALLIFCLTFWQRPRRLLHAYTSVWGAHYLAWAPFAGVRVEGRERALAVGRCVYIVNHQSMVDILAVYATRLPFLWVSKVQNFYAPFLGWNMWLNGYVPLRRGHLPSIRRMLRRAESELRSGASLCVFPEGTRSRDGELKAFYRGAFWLAVRAGVPVVPVVVEGTGSILAKGKLGIRPRRVVVRVLEPISPAQASQDPRALRDLAHARIADELRALRR
jgi:1-acyl-sn-glycerol-3-phosphate acyltransferase